jgi:hypothetical protein
VADLDAIRAALRTDRTVDITTTGARSGLPRRVEIWFLCIEGRTFITGTPGPRDWLANLSAHAELVFHLKESIEVDLDARARVVRDRATRAMVFDDPQAAWYLERSRRAELIDGAPMVELTFPALGDDERH